MPTRYRQLTRPRPTLYVPAAQFQMTADMLALRTTASLDEVARLTRATVQDIDAGVHVMRVQPFTGMLDAPLAGHRFSMRLAAIFARLMQSLLFDTAALNPPMVVAAVLILLTASVAACTSPCTAPPA